MSELNNTYESQLPEIYNRKLTWHLMPDKTEYISVLQQQGKTNFNAQEFYNESKKDEKEVKGKKMSKSALRIIEGNKKRIEKDLLDEDNRKIVIYLKDIEKVSLKEISNRLNSIKTIDCRIRFRCMLLEKFLKSELNTICHLIFFSLNDDITNDKEILKLKSSVDKEYKRKYKNQNMIEFQMKHLSSFLKPIDPLSTRKMKLDDWQLDVFDYIQKNENIIICAPTSAGKTVCSTYCTVIGNKTLFVVPSDELARQVGGIFRNISGVLVKVITNKEYFDDGNYKVLVGTPKRLEQYLTLCDRDEFTYAIYDEWHMINSDEGGSLENIFKLMNCPFLVLSATLENPRKLKDWMQKMKKKKVNLIEYKKRFIIQQRYIWNDNNLVHLHPLSCADCDFVKSEEFLINEISFTARDSFDLYSKLLKNTDKDVSHLHPENILEKTKWDEITLDETIVVEKELKKYLNSLEDDEINKVLDEYKFTETNTEFDLVKLIKILIAKKMCPAIFFKINPINCLNVFKYIVNKLKDEQDAKYPYHYDDKELINEYYNKFNETIKKTKDKEKLDKDVDAEIHFEKMNAEIEEKLLRELKSKYATAISRRIAKINDSTQHNDEEKLFYTNYYTKELSNINNMEHLIEVDKDRPHPEFCFNNMGINSTEMRKIKRELCKTTQEHIDYNHPFMIGIERGIVPYFKDMELHFQIVAQTLFSQKKIPIVISDESLGYGINLPIRTVVLLGDKDIEEIDPIIANQMSGRSGRRGLDNEGNIIYVGVNWENILRGKYNKLVGKNPINKFTPLPFYFGKFDKSDISNIFKKTLFDFENDNEYNSNEKKKDILSQLTDGSKHKENAFLIWAIRDYGLNSFYVNEIIEILSNDEFFKNKSNDYDENKIFDSLICLFVKTNELDEGDKMYEIFGDYNLNSYEVYSNTYKRKVIENINELKIFKKVADLISILDLCLKNVKLSKKLKEIFSNLKNLIKHKLF